MDNSMLSASQTEPAGTACKMGLGEGDDRGLARARARSSSQNAANCELMPDTRTLPDDAGKEVGRASEKYWR